MRPRKKDVAALVELSFNRAVYRSCVVCHQHYRHSTAGGPDAVPQAAGWGRFGELRRVNQDIRHTSLQLSGIQPDSQCALTT